MADRDTRDTFTELFHGRYEIGERLEWNGLALMHSAHGLGTQELAIAVLPLDCTSDPARSRLFYQTVQKLKELPPDGRSLPVVDAGVQRGVPFIAYERVAGVPLAELLGAGPLLPERATELALELIAALRVLHGEGVHHGDLTPANLLVYPEGLYVVGTGIAPLLRRLGPDATGPTGRGSGPNARHYLAPEILQSSVVSEGRPGPHSDVYGVGSLLFRMVAGEAPGSSPSPQARSRMAAAPHLARAIEQARSPLPAQRPDLDALAAMLRAPTEAVLSDERADRPTGDPLSPNPPASTSAKPSGEASAVSAASEAVLAPAPSRRRRGLWAAALLAFVLLAVAAAAWSFRDSPAEHSAEPSTADIEREDANEVPEASSFSGDDELEAAHLAAEDPADGDPNLHEGPADGDGAGSGYLYPGDRSNSDSQGSGPLTGDLEAELVTELERITTHGEDFEGPDFLRIYGWISRNPGDVRGPLMLGRAYTARGWYRAAIEAYDDALDVDAEAAKRDDRILRHLIDAIVHGDDLLEKGWRVLRRHWGRDVESGLQPYEQMASSAEVRTKVQSLRRRVERLPPL